MIKKTMKKTRSMRSCKSDFRRNKMDKLSSSKNSETKPKKSKAKKSTAVQQVLTRRGKNKNNKQNIPGVIKEANKKNLVQESSEKSSKAETESSESQKPLSSDMKLKKGKTVIRDIPSKLVYVFPSKSASYTLISSTVEANQIAGDAGIGNENSEESKRMDVSVKNCKRKSTGMEEKNSEVRRRGRPSKLNSIPPHYLNTSDDDVTPRWKGPLRNYSRVKVKSDAEPKTSSVTTVENSTDKSKWKDSTENYSLLKNDSANLNTVSSVCKDNINISEIREKLASAGSSITDSLSRTSSTVVSHKMKSADGLSSHVMDLPKSNPSNILSRCKVTASPKIKVSFLKADSVSSSSSVRGSDIGIKNKMSSHNTQFQIESAKANHSVNLSVHEGPVSSPAQMKSGKTKSLIVKSTPKVSVPQSNEISVYSRSSLKKSATAKPSESLTRHVVVTSSKRMRTANVENNNQEGSDVELPNSTSFDKVAQLPDNQHLTSSTKKTLSSKKRSFDESESPDCSTDANAALTKYFADPDFHFLMSLMPFLNKMSLSDRLKARIKIQEVIYDVGNFER